MREISLSLGCKPLEIPATSAGYAEYMDLERQESSTTINLARPLTRSTVGEDSIDERLNSVSRRLAEEIGDEDDLFSPTATYDENMAPKSRHSLVAPISAQAPKENPLAAKDGSVSRAGDPTGKESATTTRPTTQPITPKTPQTQSTRKSPGFCIRCLRQVYDRFASDQHNILVECLMEGNLHGGNDDSLRLHDPLPSLQDTYRYRYVPADDADKPRASRFMRRRRTWMDSVPPSPTSTPTTAKSEKKGRSEDVFYEMWREKTLAEQKFDETAAASHHSLTRVYSFLFAME